MPADPPAGPARPARRAVRVRPGAPIPADLAGAVLTRDLAVGGVPWAKGRVLDADDLAALARGPVLARGAWAGAGRDPGTITLLLPGPDDLHEDAAATRLADAVAGPGVVARPPAESRIDLRARVAGVLRVRTGALARIAAIDGLSVFTAFDGQVVEADALVASVKTGPHLVPAADVARACAHARAGGRPVVDVRPFRPQPIAAVVRESVAPADRARFAAGLATRVAALGCTFTGVTDLPDAPAAIAATLRALLRGPGRPRVLLAAGAASTDPDDPLVRAIALLGGRITSHGVPAHPGSMLLVARVPGATLLGLPTCGAYSRATAADLLLPWLVAGDPPSRATVARLAHGGILGRDQRFRFPALARATDPEPAG
ncbi:MAG: molybdopterin-binding protein [Chloroflexota bacterium]